MKILGSYIDYDILNLYYNYIIRTEECIDIQVYSQSIAEQDTHNYKEPEIIPGPKKSTVIIPGPKKSIFIDYLYLSGTIKINHSSTTILIEDNVSDKIKQELENELFKESIWNN